ncbi:Histone RNA hairpin-binding protein [Pseudolycoriella hygida]|uniref:Histone RNA hairpin-binding protein n=1 Tax=Pseudolycoriella hygida TaxID=35572 RepID=A0A9Q0MUK1_9DIPT|nr:Histone RNA hairpin-binding protein [Pseudolycoriella hygida]
MLCDSNSASLMSLDNSSSSLACESKEKFSSSKCAVNSWWEEVEAADQSVFQEEDAVNEVIQLPIKCSDSTDTVKLTVVSMDPNQLTFSNTIRDKDEPSDQFLDRSMENIDSTGANSREITLEFLDSSNGEKYERLIRDVKLKTSFKRRLSGDSRSSSPISFFPIRDEFESAADANDAKARDEDENLEEEEENAKGSHNSVPTGHGNSKRLRCAQEIETNAEILSRRQKQIDYGKNTIGYDNYIKQIPRNKRLKEHPWTPPKQYKYSRRAFDGLIKVWRTKLHSFDPPNSKDSKFDRNSESSDSDE